MSLSVPTDDQTLFVNGERFRIFLDSSTIERRVRELGREISRDYEGRTPILIGVLNGAFIFLADLMRHLTINCEMDFLKLSSYGAAKISSGNVRELKGLDATIKDRDVIIVEDIVDTGLSMQYMLNQMEESGPRSVRTAVLLHKPDATQTKLDLDYVAFRIENRFVVGYGLDYAQVGRHLPHIYQLDSETD